jgi:hypothetical protein
VFLPATPNLAQLCCQKLSFLLCVFAKDAQDYAKMCIEEDTAMLNCAFSATAQSRAERFQQKL